MYSKEVVVRCESGLHNRQATYFVQKANELDSSIWIESANRKMNAKSLLGVLSLKLSNGEVVTITADGADEKETVEKMKEIACILTEIACFFFFVYVIMNEKKAEKDKYAGTGKGKRR